MVPARLLGCLLRFSSKQGLLSVSWLLPLCSLRSWWSCRPLFAVGVMGLDVGGDVDARGMRSCVTFTCFSIYLFDHHHLRPCVVWSFFFISSVIVHVSDAQRSDGVTVASKSLSLSLRGYFGDVNSCLRLVNRAHAH